MNDSASINSLEAEIKRLIVDWERFFAGGLDVPPDGLSKQIAQQIRRLRDDQQLTAADRFRVSTLEARFNTYNGRATRRLREVEEGREAQRRAAVLSRVSRVSRPQRDSGVVIGEQATPEAVGILYESLVAQSPKTPKFDQESFGTYLEQQAAAIRKKTGCSEVLFRIAVEDGQAKLKARPVEATPADGAAAAPKKGQ